MAQNNTDRINRLETYLDMLKKRLVSAIPEKHKDSPEAFKQMLNIDLKKTQDVISKLKGT